MTVKSINIHILHTFSTVVLCHKGMALPRVAGGGDGLQLWRVDTNILNKRSRRADKGWPSSLGVGCVANNSSPKNQFVVKCYRGRKKKWFLGK